MTSLTDETQNSEGRIVGATAIVGPSTRRKSTAESMFDQAEKNRKRTVGQDEVGTRPERTGARVPVRRRLPTSSPGAA
jgi:hypothetical protein